MIGAELGTLVETVFVKTECVGQVNFQPIETFLAERFAVGKRKETSRKVVADVGQIRRYGVASSSEVHVVWEVKGFSDELLQNRGELQRRNQHALSLKKT